MSRIEGEEIFLGLGCPDRGFLVVSARCFYIIFFPGMSMSFFLTRKKIDCRVEELDSLWVASNSERALEVRSLVSPIALVTLETVDI